MKRKKPNLTPAQRRRKILEVMGFSDRSLRQPDQAWGRLLKQTRIDLLTNRPPR